MLDQEGAPAFHGALRPTFTAPQGIFPSLVETSGQPVGQVPLRQGGRLLQVLHGFDTLRDVVVKIVPREADDAAQA